MVLRQDGEALITIGQPAHAWVSGQLARAWGNERFGRLEPWEEVCLAAEQHDVGMAGWDLSPTLNPSTGRPHSFIEMPLDVHVSLWREAPQRLLAQSRYAALLVSMHGCALYELRDLSRLSDAEAQAVGAYLAEQRAFQERVIASLRSEAITAWFATAATIARNQRLLWTWDFISLALCIGWAPCTVAGVPTAGEATDLALAPLTGEGRLTLDPWPFGAERVELRCEGRRLVGSFEDEQAMRAALDAAPWVTLRFELRAAAG